MTYFAFTGIQFRQLTVLLEERRSYKLQLTYFEKLVAYHEANQKHNESIMAMSMKRFKMYEESYDLLEKEWRTVNRERNSLKYQRRWANLWKPLGAGTLLAVIAAVTISNR